VRLSTQELVCFIRSSMYTNWAQAQLLTIGIWHAGYGGVEQRGSRGAVAGLRSVLRKVNQRFKFATAVPGSYGHRNSESSIRSTDRDRPIAVATAPPASPGATAKVNGRAEQPTDLFADSRT
jgi:hypothetical protein